SRVAQTERGRVSPPHFHAGDTASQYGRQPDRPSSSQTAVAENPQPCGVEESRGPDEWRGTAGARDEGTWSQSRLVSSGTPAPNRLDASGPGPNRAGNLVSGTDLSLSVAERSGDRHARHLCRVVGLDLTRFLDGGGRVLRAVETRHTPVRRGCGRPRR